MNKYTILANFAEQAPCLTTPRPKGPAMKMAGLQVAGHCAAAHSPMTNDHSLFSEQAPSEWHTEIAENCYREARKERKGSLKVFLGALCALAVAIYISGTSRCVGDCMRKRRLRIGKRSMTRTLHSFPCLGYTVGMRKPNFIFRISSQ